MPSRHPTSTQIIKLAKDNVTINATLISDSVQGYMLENQVEVSWSGVTGKPEVFPPDTHEHAYSPTTHNHDETYSPLGHTHPAIDSSDPWTVVKMAQDFMSSLTANTIVPGLCFTPGQSKTYLVYGYFLLRTATATVGARPGVAWPANLTDAMARMEAANSLTASAIRTWGAQTTQNAASTGLATTTNSHWGSLDAMLITSGTTSGNFQITLASETAGTNVIMKAGSMLMYREI